MSSTNLNLKEHPHRRFNPLTREWVLVSPHRTQRPWQGQIEKVASVDRPRYDPNCYLCPGNSRAGGVHNPEYTGIFVFDNDFAALRPETPEDGQEVVAVRLLERPPLGEMRGEEAQVASIRLHAVPGEAALRGEVVEVTPQPPALAAHERRASRVRGAAGT